MRYRKKREGYDFFYRFKNKLRTPLLTADRVQDYQDKDGIIALTSDISAAEGDRATITNVIPITNIAGSNYNFNTANSETAYTVTRNSVINQWCQVFINSATEPTLTLGGVTFKEVGGSGWSANTDLYLYLRDLGVDGVHYSFLPYAVGSGGVTDTNDFISDIKFNIGTNNIDYTGSGGAFNGVLNLDDVKNSSANTSLDDNAFAVTAGANVDAGNNTSLIYASNKGYTEIVQVLLGAGANVPLLTVCPEFQP